MLLLSLFLKLVRLSCSGQWSAAWHEIAAACAAAIGALYVAADAFADGSRIVAALAVGGAQ